MHPPVIAAPQPIQFFPTCLVDTLYPAVGIAAVEVLERLGYRVEVPRGITCCGQPAFNFGFHQEARKVARYTVEVLSKTAGPIVIPSGSCTAMLIHQVPTLFRGEPAILARARAVADRCIEFSRFLVTVARFAYSGRDLPLKAAYHPSCHLSRGLGIREEPIALLNAIPGLELVPLDGADECCGFGGVFSVRMPEISAAIMDRKLRAIHRSGADWVVSCDAGCLMHIEGGLRRQGSRVRTWHLAQVLSGGIG